MNPPDCTCEYEHASSRTCRSIAPSRGAISDSDRLPPLAVPNEDDEKFKRPDAFCKSCDLNDQRAFEARAMCEIAQLCADLRAENAKLRERIQRLTHALHRDAGDLYDKRADSHDKPTWTYLTQGRPAGRSGDVK